MAGAKEIRTKIKSVQNTQKITRAMEMVAASKMRKAQERMNHARPYAEKMRGVIAHVSAANTEYKHPFLVTRDEVKRVGFVIVSSDRGLCGELNNNLFTGRTMEFTAAQERAIEEMTLDEVNAALRKYISLDDISIFRGGDFANELNQ